MTLYSVEWLFIHLYTVVRTKFQLEDDDDIKFVMEENGAEIEDADELQSVCAAGHGLMFLLPGENWIPQLVVGIVFAFLYLVVFSVCL